jgi:hypothetical protein
LAYGLKREKEFKISEEFMLDNISQNGLAESRYYPQPEFLVYFMSTNKKFLNKHDSKIKNFILDEDFLETIEKKSIRSIYLSRFRILNFFSSPEVYLGSMRRIINSFNNDLINPKTVFSYGNKRAYFKSPGISYSLAYQALQNL